MQRERVFRISRFNLVRGIFLPILTVIAVELFKVYTNVTESWNPRYLSWLIATVFWLIAIAIGLVNIENHPIVNVIVPGILMGMISNCYYDAFSFSCEY